MNRVWWSRTVEAAIPDTNVNARPARVVRRFRRFLESSPITIVDVGGRGGLPGELAALAPHTHVVAFEPDPEEAARLQAALAGARVRSARVGDVALGPGGETWALHVTREPGRSSLFEPNPAVIHRYGEAEAYDVVARRPVATVSAADALTAMGVVDIDFMKLDVQGFELAVLESLDAARLETLLMAECEVEFVEMYKAQPLFRHVDDWFSDHGFELFSLNRVFANRLGGRAIPYGRGQLVSGDAHYLRAGTDRLAPRALAKLILLAAYYGFTDYAAALYHSNRDRLDALAAPERAEFEAFFSPYARSRPSIRGLGSVALRILADRLLFDYLRLRRWNGLKSDSDRCYPTR